MSPDPIISTSPRPGRDPASARRRKQEIMLRDLPGVGNWHRLISRKSDMRIRNAAKAG
jgi:hypothetical protein